MGTLSSSIQSPKSVDVINRIKQQLRKRWSQHFAAFQDYSAKDVDVIVDGVADDIYRGTIRWDYGPLEPVLVYWSNRRVLGELKRAAQRYRKLTAKDPSWCKGGRLPHPEDSLTRLAVMKLVKGHRQETQLAEMVLADGELIAGTNFRAKAIQEAFQSRGTSLSIDEVHTLIDRFKKLLEPLTKL